MRRRRARRRLVAAAIISAFLFSGAVSPAFASTQELPGPQATTVSTPPGAAPPFVGAPHPLASAGSAAAASRTHTAPPASSSVGTEAVAEGGSITGHVRNRAGALANSISVFAESFDAQGNSTFRAWADSGGYGQTDGAFSITGLPAGSYYVEFYDPRYDDPPTDEWYGRTLTNQFGTPLTVTDGSTQAIEYQLAGTGAISGSAVCQTCGLPPGPDFTALLTVFDPQSSTWVPVEHSELNPNAQFDFPFLFPGSYAIYLQNHGSNQFSSLTVSSIITVTLFDTSQPLVVLSERIPAVVGIRPDINAEITALYQDFLSRRPSTADVLFWGKRLQASGDFTQVAAGFINSDEYRLDRIDAAYQSILFRSSDPVGRVNWLHALQAGQLTPDDIERTFLASQEYYLNAGNNDTGYMRYLYPQLLKRLGSPDEWAFWANLVAQHGRSWVIAQFWDSAETVHVRVGEMYAKYLGRAPDHDGLYIWSVLDARIGDSGLRLGFSGSQEYFLHAQSRYSEQ
ncbi:hypothetical protein BH09ACT6_BH09ACT6_06200 [soil metagenome]